jgi:hypothetical protein
LTNPSRTDDTRAAHGWIAFAVTLLLLCAPLLLPCRGAVPAIPRSTIDLSGMFRALSPVQGRRAGTAELRRFPVYRSGVTRDSIVLEAPARIRASLSGISGKMLISGSASHLFNIGDGLQLDIILVQKGAERLIFSRYIDPGRKAADRSWIPIEAFLEPDGAKETELEIRVSAGPQGDLTADWLGIASIGLTDYGTR